MPLLFLLMDLYGVLFLIVLYKNNAVAYASVKSCSFYNFFKRPAITCENLAFSSVYLI